MASATHRSVLLDGGSPEVRRKEIRQYFHDTFDIDEQLYDALVDDDAFYIRSDPLRHPLIFYLGHTATFFVNKLVLAKLLTDRINPRLESMFAIGVDEMSWDDLDEKNYDWPKVDEVRTYRNQVREAVDRLIQTVPLTLPVTWDSPFWAIMMGIEHQRIHLETSSVLIRQLPIDRVRPLPGWPVCDISGEAPANELQAVPGGRVVLGKTRDHVLYGWDNEYGVKEAAVEDFLASKYLVSNAEYREFVDDGGYDSKRHWTDEGWKWAGWKRAAHPHFWIRADGAYRLRLMTEVVAMPWNWPVEVNYLEAKAFCNWKAEETGESIRLPTEEEWHRLHAFAEVPDQPAWEKAPGNLCLEHHFSPCPVNEFPHGEFFDLVGNVWQWTETPIAGFQGFEVHPLYDDFSAPTFDTKHNLLMGGSWISTGNEATKHARYAFRRHFFQHAGFRYVESDQPVTIKSDVYETDQLISQYCEFHYGAEQFGVPSFPEACAAICLEHSEGGARGRALDLGCAVGRSTFELARGFTQVTGLDFSARFIRIALDMKERGYTQYVLPEEGDLVSYHEKRLADFGLEDTAGRVGFAQADACNLKAVHDGFDLVLAANLIDRLYSPRAFLTIIHERMNMGGLLVIASPYTWLTEHTEREEWLGGFKRDGENLTTREGLLETLAAHFDPVGDPVDVPFVIRETKRKFQHTISELTVWKFVR